MAKRKSLVTTLPAETCSKRAISLAAARTSSSISNVVRITPPFDASAS
jgi:hypothetical protein